MSDEIQLPEVIDMKAFEKIRADFLVRAYMKVAARYEEKVIALIALKDDLNDVTTGSEDSKMLLADIEAKRKEIGAIQAKYDEDRARFLDLQRRRGVR